MDQEPLHELNFVPLQVAVLCADCELITENRGGHCRICGGRALLNVGSLLGGPIGDQRAVLLDPATAEVNRLIEDLIESAYRPIEVEDEPDEESAA